MITICTYVIVINMGFPLWYIHVINTGLSLWYIHICTYIYDVSVSCFEELLALLYVCLHHLVARKIKYRADNAVVLQRCVRMYLALKKHRPRYVCVYIYVLCKYVCIYNMSYVSMYICIK